MKPKDELIKTLTMLLEEAKTLSPKLELITVKWLEEAQNETAIDMDYRQWLGHQINYHREKDKEYSNYLESLLK